MVNSGLSLGKKDVDGAVSQLRHFEFRVTKSSAVAAESALSEEAGYARSRNNSWN
jgi:hypothetical protein